MPFVRCRHPSAARAVLTSCNTCPAVLCCSSWCQGRVALLGDSAHAMQPNLGQGGCMAIEDAFQLGVDMAEAMDKVSAHRRALATAVMNIYLDLIL